MSSTWIFLGQQVISHIGLSNNDVYSLFPNVYGVQLALDFTTYSKIKLCFFMNIHLLVKVLTG